MGQQLSPIELHYAALAGELAKRSLELAKGNGAPESDPALDELVRLVRAAGGRCAHDLADPEPLAKAAGMAAQRGMETMLTRVVAAIGPTIRPDSVAAAKGELLATVRSLQEGVAQVAAMDVPGGPRPIAGIPAQQRREN